MKAKNIVGIALIAIIFALLFLISIKNSYEKLNAKILSQRLSKNYMQKCSACHDNYANGVIGPSLLDKNEDDIFQAIKRKFR